MSAENLFSVALFFSSLTKKLLGEKRLTQTIIENVSNEQLNSICYSNNLFFLIWEKSLRKYSKETLKKMTEYILIEGCMYVYYVVQV